MISFDDVSKVMTHPEDLARVRRRRRGVRARERRLPDAAGAALRAAARAAAHGRRRLLGQRRHRLPEGLPRRSIRSIEVMWTGTGIPSADWTADDARAYGERDRAHAARVGQLDEQRHRRQRAAGGSRAHLPGPVPAPAGGGGRACGGFFFNPMNEADLNLLPLATAGDWMASPRAYRPGAPGYARCAARGRRGRDGPARMGRDELVEQARPEGGAHVRLA